ncbi:MAG: hypothetical protein IJS09_00830, partial [Treponema sp.]|nr:hypothetical protein [Treponema sp.]
MSIKSKRNYSLSFNGLFKRLFHLFAVGFFATAMLLSSCSLFDSENGGKVVVRIDGQMAEQNLSDVQDQTVFRAGSGPDAGVLNGLFMDITINGGYSETKTVSLNSETQTQVTFFDIPIGISVYITASAYAMKNGDKTVYYEGTSEIFTIKSGTNEVSLTMQRKNTEPVKPEEPEEP